MAVNGLLVKAYTVNIYRYGNRTFSSIPAEYHEPVKQYAATNLSLQEIDNALAQGYITQQEYGETVTLIPAQ